MYSNGISSTKMETIPDFRKYKIKHNPFSFKHRYVITDEDELLIAEAKTNLFSSRFKTTIYDDFGDQVMRIRKKLFSFKRTFFIDIAGEPKYRIQRTFSFKPKIFVDALDEPDAFMVQGDIWGSEYAFYKDGEEFAFVSKKMWSFKGVYGIAVREGHDHMPVIALVIVLSLMRNDKKGS